jgi:hypothetical protein
LNDTELLPNCVLPLIPILSLLCVLDALRDETKMLNPFGFAATLAPDLAAACVDGNAATLSPTRTASTDPVPIARRFFSIFIM